MILYRLFAIASVFAWVAVGSRWGLAAAASVALIALFPNAQVVKK